MFDAKGRCHRPQLRQELGHPFQVDVGFCSSGRSLGLIRDGDVSYYGGSPPLITLFGTSRVGACGGHSGETLARVLGRSADRNMKIKSYGINALLVIVAVTLL